jgi:endonuclease/exonuclease/phosphatase family metal-dependent hydrolase
MTFKNFLLLTVVLFVNLHCSHTELIHSRGLSNFQTKKDCKQELSSLGTKDRVAPTISSSRSSGEILPPAEVKTLEPLEPQAYGEFSKGKALSIATYNVLNLKELVGRYEPNLTTGKRVKTKPEAPKSQSAIDGVANAIKEISPDILFLQEVEGEDSLVNFAKKELEDKWRPLLIKGNDGRGIHIGVLIKNSVPLHFDYESHRDEPASLEAHPDLKRVFSRDFPVLIARAPSGGDPLFILAGVHGKSKRSENNADPESRQIRTAQAEKMVEVIKDYQTKYPKTPIMVMGDFNAEVHTEPEYSALREFELKDVFDLGPNPIPTGDPRRVTHTFHPKEGSRHASQLDSILLVPPFQNLVLGAHIYRYKNPDGSEKPLPKTYAEREKNPSDHYPVWAEIDLQKLIQNN